MGSIYWWSILLPPSVTNGVAVCSSCFCFGCSACLHLGGVAEREQCALGKREQFPIFLFSPGRLSKDDIGKMILYSSYVNKSFPRFQIPHLFFFVEMHWTTHSTNVPMFYKSLKWLLRFKDQRRKCATCVLSSMFSFWVWELVQPKLGPTWLCVGITTAKVFHQSLV